MQAPIGIRLLRRDHQKLIVEQLPPIDDDVAFVGLLLELVGLGLQPVHLAVGLFEAEDCLACERSRQQHDAGRNQRNHHARTHGDDRRRVLGAQAEQGQPLAADLMSDAIADVGDRARSDGDRQDHQEPSEFFHACLPC